VIYGVKDNEQAAGGRRESLRKQVEEVDRQMGGAENATRTLDLQVKRLEERMAQIRNEIDR
jgi:septal ring factor EnvC (AmiA/AmiB activator)